MIDELEKVKAEIERLDTNIEKVFICGDVGRDYMLGFKNALKMLSNFIDSMQEEHVNGLDNGDMPVERWKQAVKAASNQRSYRSSKGLTETRDDYFVDGYHQAEKDLELTWEDIPEIFRISEQLKTNWWFRDNEQTKQIGTQVFWEEVLKRFKDLKEK